MLKKKNQNQVSHIIQKMALYIFELYQNNYEEQFMTSQVYERILVRVILKLLKYEGNYIDYGTIGYPEKNINCPSGSEVSENP